MASSWREHRWWRHNYGTVHPALEGGNQAPWLVESGLSPVGITPSRSASQNQEEHDHRIAVEKYQRANLHGFTTAELLFLNAVTDDELQPNNLQGDLHPLVARDHWEKEVPPHFKRKNFIQTRRSAWINFNGVWAASNETVWDALQPALQLVSKFLNNAHLFPFIEALLLPHIQEVPKNRIWRYWGGRARTAQDVEDLPTLFTFRQNNKKTVPKADPTEIQDLLIGISTLVRLGIFDGQSDQPGEIQPQRQEKASHHAVTVPPGEDPDGIVRLFLAWQLIAPLMRDDLKSSMRLAQQFQVAIAILHEIAHCIRFFTFPESKNLDPYFEDDRLPEVGFAFEKAIFGYRPVEIVQGDRESIPPASAGLPVAGFVLKSWPRSEDHHHCNGPPLVDENGQERWAPDNEIVEENWALSMSYIEEIQQEDFWVHLVPLWGADILKGWPLLGNTTVRQGGKLGDTSAECMERKSRSDLEEGEQWEAWVRGIRVGDIVGMGWNEKYTIGLAWDRVKKAEKIRKGFRDFQERWRNVLIPVPGVDHNLPKPSGPQAVQESASSPSSIRPDKSELRVRLRLPRLTVASGRRGAVLGEKRKRGSAASRILHHGSGDAWVKGPDGTRYWGKYGAAGVVVWDRKRGVLLQHRVKWSDHGDTWGIPGGAREQGESAVDAAFREAEEEACVSRVKLRILNTYENDLGFWSYTTVVAEVVEPFEAVIGDCESHELRWFPVDEVAQLDLHPGFADAWPELRTWLQ